MPNCKNNVLPVYGKCPCYGCEKRNLGCHDNCEFYKTYKSNYHKEASEDRQDRLNTQKDDLQYSKTVLRHYW